VNHYFDTPERGLRSAGAVLRVRETEAPPPHGRPVGTAAPDPVLAFKRGGPAAAERFEAEEHEEPLEREVWERVLRGEMDLRDVDSPVVRRAAALLRSAPVVRLGSVLVRRAGFVLPDGTRIELDESEFEDGTLDWELELEAEDLDRHGAALEDLLRRRRLPRRPQPLTKYQRFLARTGDRELS
jgi:uncharacterized protein YjbK